MKMSFFLLYLFTDRNETDCYSISVWRIMVFDYGKQPSNVTSFGNTFSSTHNIKLKEWNVTRIYGKGEQIRRKLYFERDSLYACRNNPILSSFFRHCCADIRARRSVGDLQEKSIPEFLLLACAVDEPERIFN